MQEGWSNPSNQLPWQREGRGGGEFEERGEAAGGVCGGWDAAGVSVRKEGGGLKELFYSYIQESEQKKINRGFCIIYLTKRQELIFN